MTSLHVILDGEGALKDLADQEIIQIPASELRIVCLPDGTSGGAPSVAFTFPLPDGRHVFIETTLALFQSANAIIEARFGRVS